MSLFTAEEEWAIYCMGVPSSCSPQDLKQIFNSFGSIEKAFLHPNRTDSNVVSGGVFFKDMYSAQKALDAKVVKWRGAVIKVRKYKSDARPRPIPVPKPNPPPFSLPVTSEDNPSSLLSLSDISYAEIRQPSIEKDIIRAMINSFRKVSSDKDALEALKDLQVYFYDDLKEDNSKLARILSPFIKIMRQGVKELSKNGSSSLLCTWFSILNYWSQIKSDEQRCPDHWSLNKYIALSSTFLEQIPSLINGISKGLAELLWYRTQYVMAAAGLWRNTDLMTPDNYLSDSATSLRHNSSLPMKEGSQLCAVELFDMVEVLAQNVWGNRQDVERFVKKVINQLCSRIKERMDEESNLAKKASDVSSEGCDAKSQYKESKKVFSKLISLCDKKDVESNEEENQYIEKGDKNGITKFIGSHIMEDLKSYLKKEM